MTSDKLQTIDKQQRWHAAFDAGMLPSDVENILRIEPFCSMDAQAFPKTKSLSDILFYETRIKRLNKDEIIVRQQEYGSSAFLILSGSVTLVNDLPEKSLGRLTSKRKSLFALLSRIWNSPKLPEMRNVEKYDLKQDLAYQARGNRFEKISDDVIKTLDKYQSETLNAGDFFGEAAAMSRTPYNRTSIACERTDVLEIKWQGLRDLMRYDENLRLRLGRLYKERNLHLLLSEIPLFQTLNQSQIENIVEYSLLESYGKLDWYSGFNALDEQVEAVENIANEPIIAEQGAYADGIIVIRSGYARVCQKVNMGFITKGFLRPGDIFGLDTIDENNTEKNKSYLQSLHALGNTDILRIPKNILREHLKPNQYSNYISRNNNHNDNHIYGKSVNFDAFLSHMVARRYINGTQTMIIDLDRCTGCDDCVTACARAHDNNPRFIRHGATFDKHMVVNACMHCYDPVCLIGCPTGAIFRNPDGGQIIINDQTCIGCATCANSCPYHNIRMVNIRSNDGALLLDKQFAPIQKATKCDLCVEEKVTPSCVKACPHDAMRRINFHDLNKDKNWFAL